MSNNMASRSYEDLAEAKDLRDAIAKVLASAPIDERKLRCAVWTFVGSERRAGVPPAIIIMRLTDLIDNAHLAPFEHTRALTRRTMLWCVEEYFGHLGGDVLVADPSASL